MIFEYLDTYKWHVIFKKSALDLICTKSVNHYILVHIHIFIIFILSVISTFLFLSCCHSRYSHQSTAGQLKMKNKKCVHRPAHSSTWIIYDVLYYIPFSKFFFPGLFLGNYNEITNQCNKALSWLHSVKSWSVTACKHCSAHQFHPLPDTMAALKTNI